MKLNKVKRVMKKLSKISIKNKLKIEIKNKIINDFLII